jgi:hypothetical protein
MDYAASEALVDYIDPECRPVLPRAPEPPFFSELERSVIHLSRNDPAASIPDLRGWRVGVARLFATNRASSLANERLEELRRFAILVRVRGDPGDDALDRFLDAGYTVEQAERVHWITHQGKPTGSRQGLKFVFWGVPLLLAAGIAVLVQAAVGEILNSLITVAFISVTMASFAYRRRDRLRRVSR